MRNVAVIGVGLTKFEWNPDRSVREMGEEAIWKAIKDANISPKDIQIAYCGTVGLDQELPMMFGQVALEQAGIVGIPVTRLENVCGSGSNAFREAWLAIQSGLYDLAIAIGFEKMSVPSRDYPRSSTKILKGNELEGSMGMFPPGMFALVANRHMYDYGTKREDLAMVSVKNRNHASMNPCAHFNKRITIEDVLTSRLICSPLRLLDCCPETDGFSVAILASEEVAKRYSSNSVYIAASVQVSGRYKNDRPPFMSDITERAAGIAYEMSGIGPEDLDLAEVHDCFSIAEIVAYEDLGFCKRGEGGEFIRSGRTKLGGSLPVNVSGGLIGKGHPLGATGISQIVEIVEQLRGRCGDRQVKGAKVGLTHNAGGAAFGELGNVFIHILKR
jgi:acetyl-CoA acetyltransferase